MRFLQARLKPWWERMPEPRELSTIYTIIYGVALLTGIVTLANPPRSLSAEVGQAAMASVGALLIAGAVIAMAGGANEHSRLEKIGLNLQVWALLIYASIVTILHFTTAGSRLTQVGVIILALLGCFGARWLLIWRRDKPDRG